ncbi:fimbrial protein [Pantoea ananatis]|uniref:fimbrial protein n=1 Tax=Pantoea ananas TaxID=553 RepID=UPI003FA436E7
MKSQLLNFIKSLLALMVLMCCIPSAYAVNCTSMGETDFSLPLNITVPASNNKANARIYSGGVFLNKFTISCLAGYDGIATNYTTPLQIVGSNGKIKILKINDYLTAQVYLFQVSSEFRRQTIFIPTKSKIQSQIGIIRPNSNAIVDVYLTKPLQGDIAIPDTDLYSAKFGDGESASYKVHLYGNISAENQCSIVNGELNYSFIDLEPDAFEKAGVGNKPANVNPVSRTININCTGNHAVTLQLSAPKSNNGFIESDSKDIGFLVSDQNGNQLRPGDNSTAIKLSVNDGTTQATLKAWPVSMTGKRPVPGTYTATAYVVVSYE